MFFAPEMGGYFLEHNNFIPADPLKTPEHIAPVWYFTPYYSMLRAVPPLFDSQFRGVLAMGAAVLILFALPWLDRSPVKSIRYAAACTRAAGAFVVAFLVLGYLGVVPTTVWGQFGSTRSVPRHQDIATWVARSLHGRLLPVLPADALVHGARQGEAGARAGDGPDEATIRRSDTSCSAFAPLPLLAAAATGTALDALAASTRPATGQPRSAARKPS